MTALRQDALAMVENWPEESLQVLLDYMRKFLAQEGKAVRDEEEEKLWEYDSPNKESVKFLWGLLEGATAVDAKALRTERLRQRYENYL